MHSFIGSSLLSITAAVLAWPGDAHGFAEDLCYSPGGGPIASCLPLPAVCRPVGNTSLLCQLAVIRLVGQRGNFDGGRSSVHTDVTYILAQAVGFSPTDAYWIAAYDEATDLGSFTPRDSNSMPVGDGSLTTADISGVMRTNLMSGGALLHFVAPYNGGGTTPPPGVDGLRPDPTDADVEVTLANFRAWAMAPSSSAAPACTAGLTARSPSGDYATGATCYPSSPLDGSISAFGPFDLPLATLTGPQLIQGGDAPLFAPDFDALVATDGAQDASAAHAASARLGVYLHFLADRISHHVCGDHSVISGPSETGFFADLSDAECNQPIHLLRHAWETGVPFARLAAQDRTTIAVLQAVYDELVAFARARGVLRPGADDRARKAVYVANLARALQEFEAIDRIEALNAVGCSQGLVPLPGQPACP
jgi:hypothetical protein